MNEQKTRTPARVWVGRTVTGLLAVVFGASATTKLIGGGPETATTMSHLGLPEGLIVPLAILELACLLTYLFPPTAALGAILLTGYLGGAILAHLRVGDPFFVQVGLGVLVWLGLYLRDDRLWTVFPLRRTGGRNSPNQRI